MTISAKPNRSCWLATLLGKTHVASGLAVAACRQGYRVRFYNAAALVNDLLQAQEERKLPRLFSLALKQQVIVLDELGFIPFTATGAQLIFQFCAALHEHVALIVTTDLRFADWTQVFGDERLTAALLDRLGFAQGAHLGGCGIAALNRIVSGNRSNGKPSKRHVCPADG